MNENKNDKTVSTVNVSPNFNDKLFLTLFSATIK